MGLITVFMILQLFSPEWYLTYNGTDNLEDSAIKVITVNNTVFVAGDAYNYGESRVQLLKITPSGVIVSSTFYPSGNYSHALDLISGFNKDLYICGYTSDGSGTSKAGIIVKYDTLLGFKWDYQYNVSNNTNEEIKQIINVIKNGSEYICGAASYYYSSYYPRFLSVDENGNQDWITAPSEKGILKDIAWDGAAYLFVCGRFDTTTITWIPCVYSLNLNGIIQWKWKKYTRGILNSIIYGNDGNIYAAGKVYNGVNYDIYVVSLTPQGNLNWEYVYNGSGNGDDEIYKIIEGSDGNLYVAGYVTGFQSAINFAILSLDKNGSTRWIYEYNNNTVNGDEKALALIEGGDGNIYATGYSYDGADSLNDLIVVALGKDGGELGRFKFNGESGNDKGRDLVWGNNGSLYVVGYTEDSQTSYDFLILKISVLSVTEGYKSDEAQNPKFFLDMSRTLVVNLSSDSKSPILIFNNAGQKIFQKNPVNSNIKLRFRHSGIYFIKINPHKIFKVVIW